MTLAGVVLREAKTEDYDSLRLLEQGVVEAERPYNTSLKETGAFYYDIGHLIDDQDTRFIVGDVSGAIVATGYLQLRNSKPSLVHDKHGYLGFMYVAEQYRGLGLNKLILQDLVSWGEKRGIADCYLDVYLDNRSAVRAYQKFGFRGSLLEMKLNASEKAVAGVLEIVELPTSEAPIDLLLLADPSMDAINTYLYQSRCFIAYIGERIAGVCIVKPIQEERVELMNIAVTPSVQKKGVGSYMLRHVIEVVRTSGVKRLEVGTGTFGTPLTFYQRHGFRVECIDKGFFLKNYAKPIIEDGVQHKDMLRLALCFSEDE